MKNNLFFCILKIVSAELTDTKNDFTVDTTKRFCSSVTHYGWGFSYRIHSLISLVVVLIVCFVEIGDLLNYLAACRGKCCCANLLVINRL
jgi:hypothetical protein